MTFRTPPVDVVVVCALEQPELEYLRKTNGGMWKQLPAQPNDPNLYWSTELRTVKGTPVRVLAAHPNQMGPTATAVLTAKMILKHRPRLVGMVGIAAGAKSATQNFGDVLIAERTFAHDSGKRKIEKGKLLFVPDPQPLEISPDLLSRAQLWASTPHSRDLEEIRTGFDNPPQTLLKAHVGPIASGSAVIDEKRSLEAIRSHWRKLVGLEMEAYSAHRACNDTELPAIPFLCMKSVCDFANQKSDDWQAYAAYTSSSLFMRFLHEEWDELFQRTQLPSVKLFFTGTRSLLIARALEQWLPKVLGGLESFAVEAGQWIRESDSHRERSRAKQFAILCVTPENAFSEALLYDAGVLSERIGRANVFVLSMGLDSADLPDALRQLEHRVLERGDVTTLVTRLEGERAGTSTEHKIEDLVAAKWPDLKDRLKEAEVQRLSEETIPTILRALAKTELPSPAVGQHAYFERGFETHFIYSTACAVAQKRLLVFGRKNRKLFDKERREFFEGLRSRVEAGFDFRCLFLDPDAPLHVLENAHEDSGFREDLVKGIDAARQEIVRAGLNPLDHLRIYRFARTSASIIVDDAVLSTPIHLGINGKAAKLTYCDFSAVSSNTPYGIRMMKDFNRVWQSAAQIPTGTGPV